ncbi:MAG: hypothetical protein JWQ00_1409 [Noviherbaspirillum sp.]|jgi:hypothetical protein|nr:hypothetical protein [Noviherbaspirillum sp.]
MHPQTENKILTYPGPGVPATWRHADLYPADIGQLKAAGGTKRYWLAGEQHVFA